MKHILILIFLLALSCGNNNVAEKFDKEKWKNGTQIERGNMATDLMESKILIGKTKPEIIEQLGVPKDSSKTIYHYLVDFGYMTPFHLDIIFNMDGINVKEVNLNH
ncbi:hypothetical protein [uncultured Psychroserpens sp.]|uniref:hypothetical protein n=1 Tax=uncultured Psychroserpens sp. TaxID=255436 RepID=UPI0026053611|nr:hypothetical protein [uncultured Psychroserpens sp.]